MRRHLISEQLTRCYLHSKCLNTGNENKDNGGCRRGSDDDYDIDQKQMELYIYRRRLLITFRMIRGE